MNWGAHWAMAFGTAMAMNGLGLPRSPVSTTAEILGGLLALAGLVWFVRSVSDEEIPLRIRPREVEIDREPVGPGSLHRVAVRYPARANRTLLNVRLLCVETVVYSAWRRSSNPIYAGAMLEPAIEPLAGGEVRLKGSVWVPDDAAVSRRNWRIRGGRQTIRWTLEVSDHSPSGMEQTEYYDLRVAASGTTLSKLVS